MPGSVGPFGLGGTRQMSVLEGARRWLRDLGDELFGGDPATVALPGPSDPVAPGGVPPGGAEAGAADRAADARLGRHPVRRRVPLGLQGAGDGVRRGTGVPARRRCPDHRLERHRPDGTPVHQEARGGAGADGDADGRPVGLRAVRDPGPAEGGARGGAGRRAGAVGDPEQRPGRAPDLQRPRGARGSPKEGASARAPTDTRPPRLPAHGGAPTWPTPSTTPAACSRTGRSSSS